MLLSIIGIVLLWRWQSSSPADQLPMALAQRPCVPTFVDGGGPYYEANTEFREQLAPDDTVGDRLIVQGLVLNSDCSAPLANAIVDIWQANASGEYEDDWYRGRVLTDADGYYQFETVVPEGYGEGTGYRPPHIHFKIWDDTQLLITSQMFFPEVKGTPGFEDAYIMLLETIETEGEIIHYGYHNIVVPTEPGQ